MNRWWPPSGTPMQTSPEAINYRRLGRTETETKSQRHVRRHRYRPVMDVTWITFCECAAFQHGRPRAPRTGKLSAPTGSEAHIQNGIIGGAVGFHTACCAKVADSDDPDQCHDRHDQQHDREHDANNCRLARSAGRRCRRCHATRGRR